MNSEKVFIANAPISYGAFELTVDIDPNVPDALGLLDLVLQAEYGGIDLGPVGYLGRGTELYDRLHERHLGLAGGYLRVLTRLMRKYAVSAMHWNQPSIKNVGLIGFSNQSVPV